MVAIALLAMPGRGSGPGSMGEKYQEQSLALYNPIYDLDSPTGEDATSHEGHSLQKVMGSATVRMCIRLYECARKVSDFFALSLFLLGSDSFPPLTHTTHNTHTHTHTHTSNLGITITNTIFLHL